MKKYTQAVFLLALCCAVGLSGCRRKLTPEELQSETASETKQEVITEQVTETQTFTQKQTQAQTQRQTAAKTTVTPNTQKQTQKQTQAQTTEAPAQTQQCPYCGNWFSTTISADGTSEYSSHVAQEEAYAKTTEATNSASSYDGSDYQTGSDGTLYAQCPYCFQWFSDAPDASGYSPYADHVAAEAAYAAQQQNEDYVQCPNCGNWVTQEEYQEHIANGW